MTRPHKNALEWSVFAASAVVVLAAVGYLAWSAVRQRDAPPELRVFTGTPVAGAGGHRVPVLVRNTGPATAESVRVEVLLLRGGAEVERAEIQWMYLPRRSEREGWVTFRHDPRCCAIEARASGYAKP